MKQARLVALVALVLSMFLLSSCVVAQSKYDTLNISLSDTQSQLQSTKDQLAVSQGALQATQGELLKAQAQVLALQHDINAKINELESKKKELDSSKADLVANQAKLATSDTMVTSLQSDIRNANAKLDKAKALDEILNSIFIPAFSGELSNLTEAQEAAFFLKWTAKILATGDITLITKYQTMVTSMSNASLIDFFVYLLKDLGTTLGIPYVSSI